MTAQHQIEASIGRVSISLGGVGEKNRTTVSRNILGRAMAIVEMIEMRIVDASEMEFVSVALDLDMLVDQKPVSHGLHFRDEADRVVIAEKVA